MEVDMNGIVAENGKVVTDEMIADWESALERDEWPTGFHIRVRRVCRTALVLIHCHKNTSHVFGR
jgi:hypothetical protein